MTEEIITETELENYAVWLQENEKAKPTIEKYLKDIRSFACWLGGSPVTKEQTALWKQHLLDRHYAPVTINSKLAALNSFLSFTGRGDCRVKFLKIQRRMFRDQSRELTRAEYDRLISTAGELGRHRLALLMETMGSTGIRVSEIRFITVKAAKKGRTDVSLKGKIRTILIPSKLCKKLLKYAKNNGIKSGEIFVTAGGKSLSRRQIWAEMKKLCKSAGVEQTKVFPHNLRHLFAEAFYRAYKDISGLADVLGHSSIETTRIYLVTTGTEYRKKLSRLGLLS